MPVTYSSCPHPHFAAAHRFRMLDFEGSRPDWTNSCCYLVDRMQEISGSRPDWTNSCCYFVDRMPEISVSMLDSTKSCLYFDHMLVISVNMLDWKYSCWYYHSEHMLDSLESSCHSVGSMLGKMSRHFQYVSCRYHSYQTVPVTSDCTWYPAVLNSTSLKSCLEPQENMLDSLENTVQTNCRTYSIESSGCHCCCFPRDCSVETEPRYCIPETTNPWSRIPDLSACTCVFERELSIS